MFALVCGGWGVNVHFWKAGWADYRTCCAYGGRLECTGRCKAVRPIRVWRKEGGCRYRHTVTLLVKYNN